MNYLGHHLAKVMLNHDELVKSHRECMPRRHGARGASLNRYDPVC